MAISSIEHRSGWYDISDARGKKQKLFLTTSENCWDGVTVFSLLGEAVGMTLMTSKAIKSKLSQQTSATLFLSVLISLSSDEVHGLIHMMLGERR